MRFYFAPLVRWYVRIIDDFFFLYFFLLVAQFLIYNPELWLLWLLSGRGSLPNIPSRYRWREVTDAAKRTLVASQDTLVQNMALLVLEEEGRALANHLDK